MKKRHRGIFRYRKRKTKLKINMIRKSCRKNARLKETWKRVLCIKNWLRLKFNICLVWLLRFHIWTGWLLVRWCSQTTEWFMEKWLRHEKIGKEKKIKRKLPKKNLMRWDQISFKFMRARNFFPTTQKTRKF